jgi:hypothetical protein
MPDINYGRMFVIRAMRDILKNPKATVKQKLEAARMIAMLNGWDKPGAIKRDDPEVDKILGGA